VLSAFPFSFFPFLFSLFFFPFSFSFLFSGVREPLLRLVLEALPRYAVHQQSAKERLTPLHCAALCGHPVTVRCLVYSGADVNPEAVPSMHKFTRETPLHPTAQGTSMHEFTRETPLHLAARACWPEVVAQLTKLGANPNVTSKHVTPLLLLFSSPANKSLVAKTASTLLRAGARSDLVDSSGDSIIHLAYKSGGFAAVRELVENGADIDAGNKVGETLVQYFLEKGEIENAIVLARMGAKKVKKNWNSDNVQLFMAVLTGDVATVAMLAKGKFQAIASKASNTTALHVAVSSGNINVIRKLVEMGDSVHKDGVFQLAMKDKQMVAGLLEIGGGPKAPLLVRSAPLHAAVQMGNIEILAYLIELGIDANIPNSEGDPPLFIAALNNKPEFVKRLVELGADANKPNSYGDTALLEATKHGNIAAALEIVKCGVDVNARGGIGYTALHYAAGLDSIPLVQELAKQGADLNAKNSINETPLMLALNYNTGITAELIRLGASFETAQKDKTILHEAVMKGKPKSLETLLNVMKERGEEHLVQQTTPDGRNLMHIAAVVQSTGAEMCRLLAKVGVDPKWKSAKGDTPLHFASNAAAVKELVALGVDINAQNNEVIRF
jgi:ankyrin repeat protein